jgi:hypothetical protein
LQPGDPARPPVDLLRPFDADKMTAWNVDKAVGNVKNDTCDLLEEQHDSEPKGLFVWLAALRKRLILQLKYRS